jgi:prephenate dehydrogenase
VPPIIMEALMFKKIGFVGLGLIGGSLAKLIRENDSTVEIYGVARREETIIYGVEKGLIDAGSTEIENLPSDLDLVFICTPIGKIVDSVKQVEKIVGKKTIITDVGSVKEGICSALKKIDQFIPGHPMAGTEKVGIQYSDAAIMKSKTYILIKTDSKAYKSFKTFLEKLQFNILEMSAKEHDKLVAYASHVPYLMATLTKKASQGLTKKEQETYSKVIGSGFKDTTRVAASDPQWGVEVFEANKQNMMGAIADIKRDLEEIEKLLSYDKLQELNQYFSN